MATLPLSHTRNVRIACGPVEIGGQLDIPDAPSGVVLFAHDCGKHAQPLCNRVATRLFAAGMATLQMDLLTPQEEHDCRHRFNISLLTQRLRAPAIWLRNQEATRSLPLGLFGTSTAAAAALELAAMSGFSVSAVVLRGGRPDLAWHGSLERLSVPVLLVVGGLDDLMIDLNEEAYAILKCEKQLAIVPGATHLFEEPGKSDVVADLARAWFLHYLRAPVIAHGNNSNA